MARKTDPEMLRPEELVRRENKAVNILRALLITVLIVVGSILSYESYQLQSEAEHQTYQRDFKAVASRFTGDFRNSVTEIMGASSVFAAAVSSSSDLVKAAPNITIPYFDQLVGVTVQKFRSLAIYWAPLLRDATERREWEAYAQEQINASTAKNADVCNACGDKNLTIGLRDKVVEFPTGTYTCSDLDYVGLTGAIPKQYCSLLISYVQDNCGCRAATKQELEKVHLSAEPRSNRIYETTDHEISGKVTSPVKGPGPHAPVWQVYPSSVWSKFAMYDTLSDKYGRGATKAALHTHKTIFSEVSYSHYSSLLSPVFGDLKDGGSSIIGTISIAINWVSFLEGIVPYGSDGIQLVIDNSCGQKMTFASFGQYVAFVGNGDRHDPAFSSMVEQTTFDDYYTSQNTASPYQNGKESSLNCAYRLSVYSSEKFRSNYITDKPRLYATVVSLIFVFTGLLFVTYDCYVARRQQKLMKAVLQRDDIVSSLFPAAVRERLFNARQSPTLTAPKWSRLIGRTAMANAKIFSIQRQQFGIPPNHGLSVATTIDSTPAFPTTEPIADFFPNVTIVYADISGFTAWSSEREPSQVFQLLETVYQAFDTIATKHGVFKIETIGDCYVAVAGLPVFQPDHAVRIVKFAYECILHMHELTHDLESTLGPSTSSLTLRVGIHSGPVTAGVLRGEKCRFQLFGDTVNMTARMQTSSENNKMHVSSSTASLLEEAEKSNWLQPRNGQISIKGKGSIQTYWVDPHTPESGCDNHSQLSDVLSTSHASRDWGDARLPYRVPNNKMSKDKVQRLVEWNTDLLLRLLKKTMAARNQQRRGRPAKTKTRLPEETMTQPTPFDAVTEIIPMQDFSQKEFDDTKPDLIDPPETVRLQLLDYVTTIASMYHDNPFHNFEHASHVALSASKVVMRIIRPDVQHQEASLANRKGRLAFKRKIHESTFGISSDALMQFAAVFSAVIHDVDHVGVSNAQLVKEGHDVALRYHNKCVAEQNSVDIAWGLLTKPQYRDLLACICPDNHALQRFHQLLVNAVLATDIADKELNNRRKNRWDKAFHCELESAMSELCDAKTDTDRRATIVFEYIIQASDVAHTMQHWKVYTLWNEKLFEERYKAYLCGREEHDPSIGWYKGEIWFFDNYIIPLAKKLETCGVFGVSSDEYLSYALENRHEWELKGEEIVRSMTKKLGVASSSDEIQEAGEMVEQCPSGVVFSRTPGQSRRHSAFG